MKKVLMVMDNLYKDSGVVTIIMNLYSLIDKKQVKIDFLIFQGNNSSRAENNSCVNLVRDNGSKVFILKNPLSVKQCLPAWREVYLFFKEHSNEYDIVHLNSPTLTEFTLRYAKKYGIPHRIIHSHSTMTSPNPIKKIINALLQRRVCKYANHFWSCSSEAAEFLYGKEFCSTHDVELIKNAVRPEKYVYNHSVSIAIREELGWSDCTIVIHVSNFSPIKNIRFLLPVIKATVQKNSKLRYLFVGDGPTRETVEGLLQDQNLSEYVHFTGRTSCVNDYLNAADVLLLPSIKEGLPVTVVEAQACGLRCLVSDSVTKEVNIGNVIFLPLKEESWIEFLSNIEPANIDQRKKACWDFEKSPFNIYNEAKRVERLYLEMR